MFGNWPQLISHAQCLKLYSNSKINLKFTTLTVIRITVSIFVLMKLISPLLKC